jgi:FkbM family methyltransferase
MLRRALSSLSYRARWARLGVYYGRSLRLNHVKIGGRRVDLNFPASERATQEHEFNKIVLDDCYQLSKLPDASTVLDIGANIGLFALAARRAFPKAIIHCYEPNPAIISNLDAHCVQADCEYFPAAVGLKEGKVSLQKAESGTLFSKTLPGNSGQIDQVSFAAAVAKLGQVDLLKLDCEGAEWEIFLDTETWKRVRHLTMEYHLWSKVDSTTESLRTILSSLGFDDIEVYEDAPQWGRVLARRRKVK